MFRYVFGHFCEKMMSSNGFILKFSSFSLGIFKHINILCNDINSWDNNTILIIKKVNLPLE